MSIGGAHATRARAGQQGREDAARAYADPMIWLGWTLAVAASTVAGWALARLRTERRRTRVAELAAAKDADAARSLAASDERARIAREMHDVGGGEGPGGDGILG